MAGFFGGGKIFGDVAEGYVNGQVDYTKPYGGLPYDPKNPDTYD